MRFVPTGLVSRSSVTATRLLHLQEHPKKLAPTVGSWNYLATATTTTTSSSSSSSSSQRNLTTSGSNTMKVASRPSDLVGHTPLLDLGKILEQAGVNNGSRLLGKLESLGPCSSVKDRLGLSMIDDAEARGVITPGETVLVEPTSGNTGIALAFIARERGYRCILTMPETMSVERRMMLLALGCEVVLTPKETAVPGALAKAHEILQQLDGKGYMLQQFENPANPKVHRETVRELHDPFFRLWTLSIQYDDWPGTDLVFFVVGTDRTRDLEGHGRQNRHFRIGCRHGRDGMFELLLGFIPPEYQEWSCLKPSLFPTFGTGDGSVAIHQGFDGTQLSALESEPHHGSSRTARTNAHHRRPWG